MRDKTDTTAGLIRLSSAAHELGVSRSTAYRWARQGTIPVIQLHEHRGLWVPRDALDALRRVWAEQAVDNLGSGDAEAPG